MWNCLKCGFAREHLRDDCPRCTEMLAKSPDLIAYVEACIERTREDERNAAWEREMGDDL
jgi:hypothetical protein